MTTAPLPASMRAVVARAPRDLDAVSIVYDAPLPRPGPGELRIRVTAVGLNPADWKVIARGVGPSAFPGVIGLDAVGIVDAAGPLVAGVAVPAPGVRVCVHTGIHRLAAFADAVVVPADTVALLPDTIDDASAGAIPTAGFTAWQIVRERLGLRGGEAVLVVNGSGALGGFLIGAARALGARVIATASAGREASARLAGALEVLDSALGAAAIAGAAERWNGGRPVDAVIDAGGSAEGGRMVLHVGYGGHYVACNGPGPLPPHVQWPRGITVHDVFLGGALVTGHRGDAARIGALGTELASSIGRGDVAVPAHRRIAFDDIPRVLRAMAAGDAREKHVAVLG